PGSPLAGRGGSAGLRGAAAPAGPEPGHRRRGGVRGPGRRGREAAANGGRDGSPDGLGARGLGTGGDRGRGLGDAGHRLRRPGPARRRARRPDRAPHPAGAFGHGDGHDRAGGGRGDASAPGGRRPGLEPDLHLRALGCGAAPGPGAGGGVTPAVSVIVPTRNSAATLEACLRSILAQSLPVELLVVDNFSTDATPAIARRLASSFEQAGPERRRQRNLGPARPAGAYFLFVASHSVLPPPVVAECLEQAAAGVRAVIIPEVSTGRGFWAAAKALERACYLGDDTIEAARFFDRSLFQEL